MNSFLDLHSDSDYRNINRPYYTGTWEYTNIKIDRFIPFQFISTGSDALLIQTEDTAGTLANISSGFEYPTPASPLVNWTKSGGGSWSNGYFGQIVGGTVDNGGKMTSDPMTLTANRPYVMYVDPATNNGTYSIKLLKGAVVIVNDLINQSGHNYFVLAATGSDYTVEIENQTGTSTVQTHTPTILTTSIGHSGSYWWYTGAQLISTTLTDILRLRITCGADIFYSDWCEAASASVGWAGKTKIAISSSYDYGGIKYVLGYTQYMYKNATVRRAPKAEIEITGDKLNGSIIEEKKTTAVRYKIIMKCTESEYEGLVHAMGGTLTITDQTGKSYTAVNIELSDPTWYRSNGIVELSFVDSANINTWTMNNSAL